MKTIVDLIYSISYKKDDVSAREKKMIVLFITLQITGACLLITY